MIKILRMIGCLLLTVLFGFGAYDTLFSPITRPADSSFRMPLNVPIVMPSAGMATMRSLSPFMFYKNDQMVDSMESGTWLIGFAEHITTISFETGDVLLLSARDGTVTMMANQPVQYYASRQIAFRFVSLAILALFFLILLSVDLFSWEPMMTLPKLAEYTVFGIIGWVITMAIISFVNGYFGYEKTPAIDYQTRPILLSQDMIIFISEPVNATVWAQEDFVLPLPGLAKSEGEPGSDVPGLYLDHVVLPKGFIENDTDLTFSIQLVDVPETAYVQWFRATDRGHPMYMVGFTLFLLLVGYGIGLPFANTTIFR